MADLGPVERFLVECERLWESLPVSLRDEILQTYERRKETKPLAEMDRPDVEAMDRAATALRRSGLNIHRATVRQVLEAYAKEIRS